MFDPNYGLTVVVLALVFALAVIFKLPDPGHAFTLVVFGLAFTFAILKDNRAAIKALIKIIKNLFK